MTQVLTIPGKLASVGEAIPHQLGATMIKDYQNANPGKETGNYIGREILEKILAQPGCVGINFYNAINEVGRETLVYVGVDNSGQVISRYSGVDSNGELVRYQGIVADRSWPPTLDDKEEHWYDWILEMF